MGDCLNQVDIWACLRKLFWLSSLMWEDPIRKWLSPFRYFVSIIVEKASLILRICICSLSDLEFESYLNIILDSYYSYKDSLALVGFNLEL